MILNKVNDDIVMLSGFNKLLKKNKKKVVISRSGVDKYYICTKKTKPEIKRLKEQMKQKLMGRQGNTDICPEFFEITHIVTRKEIPVSSWIFFKSFRMETDAEFGASVRQKFIETCNNLNRTDVRSI